MSAAQTSSRMPRVRPTLPALCAVAVVAIAAWALWPLGSAEVALPETTASASAPEAVAAAPLDLQAFRAPLWVAPPAPPAPPVAAAPAPPPPPLKLQLIAIVREAGKGETIYKAALYDPDADTLTVVGPGDTIAGRTIERVGASDMALTDNGRSRTLSLRTEGGGPP